MGAWDRDGLTWHRTSRTFSVLLRRDGQSQLVYKHAISTVMPAQPISLYNGEEETAGEPT